MAPIDDTTQNTTDMQSPGSPQELPTDDTSAPETELTPLETAENQAREYLDALQRLKAEFDNFRKRTERDRRRMIDLHQASVIEALLPTLDAFEAAFQQDISAGAAAYTEGFELILTGLRDVLSKLGLERLAVVGEPFDPETSDAMTTVQSPDHEPGAVVQEITAGYRFKDRIIRPAKVIVAAE